VGQSVLRLEQPRGLKLIRLSQQTGSPTSIAITTGYIRLSHCTYITFKSRCLPSTKSTSTPQLGDMLIQSVMDLWQHTLDGSTSAKQDTTRHDESAPQDTSLLSSVNQVDSGRAWGQHHTDTACAQLGAMHQQCLNKTSSGGTTSNFSVFKLGSKPCFNAHTQQVLHAARQGLLLSV